MNRLLKSISSSNDENDAVESIDLTDTTVETATNNDMVVSPYNGELVHVNRNNREVDANMYNQQQQVSFMQVPQYSLAPQQGFDQMFNKNVVQQSDVNRMAANIMFNAADFGSGTIDYAAQSVNYLNPDLKYTQMKDVTYGDEIKMEEDPDYMQIKDNNDNIRIFQKEHGSDKIDIGKFVGIQGNYEQVLSKEQKIGDIVKMDHKEIKMSVLLTQAQEKVTDKNIASIPLFQRMDNGIKVYLLSFFDKLKKNGDLIELGKWLLEKSKYPKHPNPTKFFKNDQEMYNLLTVLNYLVTRRVSFDRTNISDFEAKDIALDIIDVLSTYIGALKVGSARNARIQEFDEFLEALRQVSLNYVSASPQLSQAVSTLSAFMSDFMQNWSLLGDNDKRFTNMLSSVFGQLNTFITQGNITRQNFETINDNFQTFYQEYQQLYGNTMLKNINTSNQLNAIKNDIGQLKTLFSILTTGTTNGQSVNNVMGAVSQIYNMCNALYNCNGFTQAQMNTISGILNNWYNMPNGVKEQMAMEIKRQIANAIETADKNYANAEKTKAEFDKINDLFNEIGKALSESGTDTKTTLPDLFEHIKTDIGNLKDVVQDHTTKFNSLEESITTNNARIDKIEKDIDGLGDRFVTHDKLEEFNALTVEEVSKKVLQWIKESQEKNDENLDNLKLALERTIANFPENLDEIEMERRKFNKTYHEEVKTPGDGNIFAQFYSSHLPKEKVMNDLTQNIDCGITLLDYINKCISGFDKVTVDVGKLGIDIESDKALILTQVMYLFRVFDKLLEYTGIDAVLPKDAIDLINSREKSALGLINLIKSQNKVPSNVDWEGITKFLNALKEHLNNMKNIKSDTDLSNVMAITKTKGKEATETELWQKAWMMLVSGCRLIKADVDPNADESAIDSNDIITINIDSEVTVYREKFIKLLQSIGVFLPDVRSSVIDIMGTGDRGTEKFRIDALILEVKRKRDNLVDSDKFKKKNKAFRERLAAKKRDFRKDMSTSIKLSELARKK